MPGLSYSGLKATRPPLRCTPSSWAGAQDACGGCEEVADLVEHSRNWADAAVFLAAQEDREKKVNKVERINPKLL